MSHYALYLIPLVLGLGLGSLLHTLYYRKKVGNFQKLAASILQGAEGEAEKIRAGAEEERRQKQFDQQRRLEEASLLERRKIQAEEARLKEREDKLESRMGLVEKKLTQIEKREAVLGERKLLQEEEKRRLAEEKEKLKRDLEIAAGLTAKEAKEKLVQELTEDLKFEKANLIRKTMKEAEEESERLASSILAQAINRLAVPTVSEATINTVSLPGDEIKGRIIGREGRNIRALERATGITFIIDDTPGAIVLSGYDPIRMHVAKLALSELVKDGRVHPTRIEEAVERAKDAVERKVREYGQDAALRAGQANLHPELIQLLGKLKFRFSYGQNVLDHSLEVSYLMGMIASELHLNVSLAKRIGLLHDMGKAVSHDVPGTHALIGHDLALKYGETQEVANGIGCHHGEIPPITVEGSFCGAADAISASGPGARIEAVEEYIKRVKKLEEIAYEFPGIEKAYAMQAGKELCIVVMPEMFDDAGLTNLARDLSKRIEKELRYPGKIKVTAIREKRAVEYAV